MIVIRNSFHAEELPRLYEIETACFPEVMRWEQEKFNNALLQSDVWVADLYDHPSPKEVTGFLVSKIKQHMGYIMSVDIAPDHRRKGIGAKLMYAAEDHYKTLGLKKIFLEVAVDNPAQTLYFKLGYRVTGFRSKYYDDGSSCLVMTKSI